MKLHYVGNPHYYYHYYDKTSSKVGVALEKELNLNKVIVGRNELS